MRLLAQNCGLVLLGLLTLVTMGCGGGAATGLEVTGNVTLDGKPVDSGTVVFETQGTGQGSTVGGEIVDGKYRIAPDAGLKAGKKLVRIHAIMKTGKQVEASPPTPPGTMIDETNFVPITPRDAEVKEQSGPQEISFTLTEADRLTTPGGPQ